MKISEQLKHAIWLVGLGASLVLYAQTQFATKETMVAIKTEVGELQTNTAKKEDMTEIKGDLKEIRNLVIQLVKESK